MFIEACNPTIVLYTYIYIYVCVCVSSTSLPPIPHCTVPLPFHRVFELYLHSYKYAYTINGSYHAPLALTLLILLSYANKNNPQPIEFQAGIQLEHHSLSSPSPSSHSSINETWTVVGEAILQHIKSSARPLFAHSLEKDIRRAPSDGLANVITALRRNEQYRLALFMVEQALSVWGLSLRILTEPGALSIKHIDSSQRYILEDLLYEGALCAWYGGEAYRSFGLALSDILLLDPQASQRSHRYLWSNVGFYVTAIPYTRVWDVDIDLPFISPNTDSQERYRPLNPSLIKDDDGGYTVLCKAVNFDQLYGREYYVLDDTGYVNIRNFLIKLDKDLVRQSQYEIVEDLERVRFSDHGLEDMRIARVRGDLWFTAFTRSVSELGNSLTVVGRIANPSQGTQAQVDDGQETLRVEQMMLMEVPDYEVMEKNWLPFNADGELNIVYSVGPNMVVLRPNVYTGENETLHWQSSPFYLNRFRGSAGPLKFHFNGVEGQLFVVHEVVYAEYAPGRTSRTYYHRFVFADDSWVVTHLSRPFIFQVKGVEFCTGMVESHEGGSLLVSVGIQDRQARIFEVAMDQVASMLVEPSLLYS